MSWSRYGSPCSNTVPQYEVDVACVANGCPGSSLYIYESNEGLFVCRCVEGGFRCATRAEMYAHISEHDTRGDHVRRSLLYCAKNGGVYPELDDRWK